MRKIAFNVVCALTTLSLMACGDNNTHPAAASSAANTSTDAVVASADIHEVVNKTNEFAANLPANAPVIKVATETNYPPFDFLDKDGLPTGFEVDVMNAIAADQGLKVQIVNTPFKDIFNGLAANQYDAAMSVLGITEERKAKFEITDVYVQSPDTIVVLADSPIKKPEDLKDKRVTVMKGSVAEKYIPAFDNSIKVQDNTTWALMIKDLFSGATDAISGDKLALSNILRDEICKVRFMALPISDHQAESANVVFLVGKGNTDLRDKLNTGLANIKANGIYDKIYAKWFGATK